jgi:hypothetical protein
MAQKAITYVFVPATAAQFHCGPAFAQSVGRLVPGISAPLEIERCQKRCQMSSCQMSRGFLLLATGH